MRFGRKQTTPDNLPAKITDSGPSASPEASGVSARMLSNILESSTRLQAPAVRAYVARLRRTNPDASPAAIVTKLEKHYLSAVMASGAAVGSAAAWPGIGTVVALSAVAGETVVFLEATAAFVLAVAEVHGIPVQDRERRRYLVLAALVGEDGSVAVKDLLGAGRTSGAWLAEAELLPLPVVSQLNSKMTQYFIKKYAIKRTAMAFGKLLPVGIGAAVGGGGNRLIGKRIVQNARAAFGPAPARWPVTLHVLPGSDDVTYADGIR